MGRLWTVEDAINAREASDQFEPSKHVQNGLAEVLKAAAAEMPIKGKPPGLLTGEPGLVLLRQRIAALDAAGVTKRDEEG